MPNFLKREEKFCKWMTRRLAFQREKNSYIELVWSKGNMGILDQLNRLRSLKGPQFLRS